MSKQGDPSMRHLITLGLFVAAGVAYFLGLGPLFFGEPLLGSVLVAAGVVFELASWHRVMRSRSNTAVRIVAK
jgi:hypothetical protein